MSTPASGSKKVAEGKKKGLLWLLLGLLGLLLIGGLVALALGDDENEPAGPGASQSPSPGTNPPASAPPPTPLPDGAPSGQPGGTGGAPGTTPGSVPGLGATAGALTSETTNLVDNAGTVRDFVDKSATGEKVRVQSVVSDEGFWVGDGPAKRVFVFLQPSARNSAGESPFQVEAGQLIALEGTVKAAGADFVKRSGVTPEEGADELTRQGAYLDVTKAPELSQ